jgi:hypothetical protein
MASTISTCALSEEGWSEGFIVKHTFIHVSKAASLKRVKSDSQIRYCDYGESSEAAESLADENRDSTKDNRVLDSLADAETASGSTESLTDDDDFACIETSSTVTEFDFDDIRPSSSLSSVAARLEMDAANLDRQAAQVKAQAQTATEVVQRMSQAAEFRAQAKEAEKGAQLAHQAVLLSAQVQEAEAVAKLAQCKVRTLCLQLAQCKAQTLCVETKSRCIDVALAHCTTADLQQGTASNAAVTQQAIGQRGFLQSAIGQQAIGQEFTTLCLRNVPNNHTRSMLIKLLDQEGFSGHYDLVYVPVDFTRFAGLGYAFVNFSSNEAAEKAIQTFQGFKGWGSTSQKVCDVSWSGPLQGLEAHIERYRNSPVMHESVSECYKPAFFQGGFRLPFPCPTKEIRRPRVKYGRVHTQKTVAH